MAMADNDHVLALDGETYLLTGITVIFAGTPYRN